MKDDKAPKKVEEQLEAVEEPVVEEAKVEPEVEESPSVDRSAFNCPDCKGEGLVDDNFEEGGFVRCPKCLGTGKV